MGSLKKTLLIIAAIFFTISLLTLIGVVIGSKVLIAAIGFTLYFLFFLIFATADRLAIKIKSLQGLSFFQENNLQKILRFIQEICLRFSLIVRSVFLSLSFWVVGFYLSLNDGNLRPSGDETEYKLLASLFSIVLAVIDTARGKSIKKQGLPSRIMSTVGFFTFFKNFILLFASGSNEIFEPLKKLFSNPLWFLFNSYKYDIIHMGGAGFDMLLALLILSIFLFTFGISIFHKPKEVRLPNAKIETDARNAGIALIVLSCWLATAPIYSIGAVIFFLLNNKK